MIKNWMKPSRLHGLFAGLLTLASLAGTARADPAPPRGENAIYEKMNEIRRGASDSTSITRAYAGQYCGSANGGVPQATPDGIGAYIGLYNVNVNQVTCAIYWSPATGAHAIWAGNFHQFAREGYEKGVGYPLTDTEYTSDHNYVQTFSFLRNGFPASDLESMIISSSHGSFTIRPPVLANYRANGGERGVGVPVSNLMQNQGTNVCHPGLNNGCTTGEQGSPHFDLYQAFQLWNASTRTWRQSCACVITSNGWVGFARW